MGEASGYYVVRDMEIDSVRVMERLSNTIPLSASKSEIRPGSFDRLLRQTFGPGGLGIDIDNCSTALLIVPGQRLRLYDLGSPEEGFEPSATLSFNESIIGEAIAAKSPRILGEVSGDLPDRFQAYLWGCGYRSALIFPVYLCGVSVGTINFASIRPNAYSREHLELLTGVRRELNELVCSTPIFDGIKSRLSKVPAIRQMAEKLIRMRDWQEVYDFLSNSIKNLFDLSDLIIGLRIKGSGEGLALGEGVSAAPWRKLSGESNLSCGDRLEILDESRIGRDFVPINSDTKSVLLAPLKLNDSVRGELVLESRRPNCFSWEDTYIIGPLVDSLALIIERAEAERQIGKLARELENKSIELMALGVTVEKLDQQRSNLLHFVAHDIKSPLMAIRGYGQMLQSYFLNTVSEESDVINEIVGICDRLLRLIGDRASSFKEEELDNLVVNRKKMKIDKAIADVAKEFYAIAAGKKVRLKMELEEDLPAVEFDRDKIQSALANLLDNAIRFSRPGQTVTVGARRIFLSEVAKNDNITEILPPNPPGLKRRKRKLHREFVEVWVGDHGPGVPKVYREKIFEKYFRGPGSMETRPNLGLGLYVVKQIIKAHEGYLKIESVPGGGSKFIFGIPV